jgi:hypothetical protein
MTRSTFRFIVGLSVIAGHAFCYYILLYWKTDWLSAEQRQDVSLLLLPITSAYFVAIIRSAIDNQYSFAEDQKVNAFYSSVVLLVTFLFLGALISLVLNVPGPRAPTLDDIRREILLLEIAFGAGFGLIAADLFGRIDVPPAEGTKLDKRKRH